MKVARLISKRMLTMRVDRTLFVMDPDLMQ